MRKSLILGSSYSGEKKMDVLIKGGMLVTATASYQADIAITGEKISAIGNNLRADTKTEVVDAKGKLVLPGP